MTDDELARDVAAELSWDPEAGSGAVDVSADGGTVTLRGTVASLREKRAAGRAAARVYGVTAIINELAVLIPDVAQRDDDDLRGDVLEALMLDGSVPMTVNAQACDGLVTLTGAVDWHYQRNQAESRAARVTGVTRIDNAITLTQPPDGRDAGAEIARAWRRNAMLATSDISGDISVDAISPGAVVLSGTVRSWAAHDNAVAAAWSAPGVTDVDDRIRVEYQPAAGTVSLGP
jgi:osmotically-inducible protein OsmY